MQAGGGSALDWGVNGAPREVREQEPPLATLPWQHCIVESEQKLPGELFQQHWWGTGLRQGRAGGEPGSGRAGLVGNGAQAGQAGRPSEEDMRMRGASEEKCSRAAAWWDTWVKEGGAKRTLGSLLGLDLEPDEA